MFFFLTLFNKIDLIEFSNFFTKETWAKMAPFSGYIIKLARKHIRTVQCSIVDN